MDLPLGKPLYLRDEDPRYLYFLTSGIGSVVFNSVRGTTVELSTQGAEGVLGWANLLGPERTPSDASMQVAGAGYRIPLAAIQHEFDTSAETRHRVLEYVQHQSIVANQVVACNRLHRAEARFVRWMLMVSDRIHSDDLPMTQEFMSVMLGTRRTTVTEVSSELARAGAVEGRRGGLRIINRKVLESRVCECYPILRARYDALYRAPVRAAEAALARV
jgi:CRP-like cAMP-binding protein